MASTRKTAVAKSTKDKSLESWIWDAKETDKALRKILKQLGV
jgi:hypothetical protein